MIKIMKGYYPFNLSWREFQIIFESDAVSYDNPEGKFTVPLDIISEMSAVLDNHPYSDVLI